MSGNCPAGAQPGIGGLIWGRGGPHCRVEFPARLRQEGATPAAGTTAGRPTERGFSYEWPRTRINGHFRARAGLCRLCEIHRMGLRGRDICAGLPRCLQQLSIRPNRPAVAGTQGRANRESVERSGFRFSRCIRLEADRQPPSRNARFRASFRARLMASAFSRARFSDGFS